MAVVFFFGGSPIFICAGFAPVKYYGGQFGGRPSSREKKFALIKKNTLSLHPKNKTKSHGKITQPRIS